MLVRRCCVLRVGAPRTTVAAARLSRVASRTASSSACELRPAPLPMMAAPKVAAGAALPRAGLTTAPRTALQQGTRNELPRTIRHIFRSYSTATMSMPDPSRYRNFAIIAHVDHGKTSLVDKLLHQGAELNEGAGERVMDSNDLERERGITILAKTTSITWNGYHFNIVDTPGHGDFGGEVERVLNMVDGVILLVDASEGPMPQTKFVLTKALRQGLRPIVVLNKMDRDTQRAAEVEGEIFDLFAALDATPEQLSYPTLYASARQGWAVKTMGDEKKDMTPLFETVLSYVPPPKVSPAPSFQMLVTMLEADDFLGKIVIGKVSSGSIRVGQPIKVLNTKGEKIDEGNVIKILAKRGLQRLLRDNAVCGDIVGLAGVSKATVTDTICEPLVTAPIPAPPIEPPVISMAFGVNDSPLAGKEGSRLTSNFIRDRLIKETDHNPAVKFVTTGSDSFEVSGRGELQMSVLIENMRREGFELVVGTPNVIFKVENGQKLEPIEEVTADVDADQIGLVIERLTARKAELKEMKQFGTRARLTFLAPVRGLLGFRSEFTTETRGTGVLNSSFHSYAPYKGGVTTTRKGAIISQTEGITTTYALESLAERGTLFIGAQTPVYSGMIIGESSKPGDIESNPCKSKHLTNMRAVGKEEVVRIPPPKIMTLEEAISYVGPDELMEVTPKSIRLRKKELDENKRRRNSKASMQAKKN